MGYLMVECMKTDNFTNNRRKINIFDLFMSYFK